MDRSVLALVSVEHARGWWFLYALTIIANMSSSCGNEPGDLVQSPLTNYVKPLELLSKHSSKDYHKAAITRADEFLKVMTGQKPNIHHCVDQSLSDNVSRNCQKLRSIVSSVLLCGRQNLLLLHNHNDSFTTIERDTSANHGTTL